MNTSAITSAIILIATLAPGLAHAEMYRWVDENGVTHYGDRIPPQYTKQRREVIDPHGRVVNVIKREATAAERAAARKKQQQDAAAKAVAAQKAQYDRSLTDTYTNVEQLDAAYQDRIMLVDSKIKSATKNHEEINATLASLRKRAAGKKPKPALDKTFKQEELRMHEQEAALKRLRRSKAQIEQRYQSDRERFLMLTADKN